MLLVWGQTGERAVPVGFKAGEDMGRGGRAGDSEGKKEVTVHRVHSSRHRAKLCACVPPNVTKLFKAQVKNR